MVLSTSIEIFLEMHSNYHGKMGHLALKRCKYMNTQQEIKIDIKLDSMLKLIE